MWEKQILVRVDGNPKNNKKNKLGVAFLFLEIIKQR